MILNKKINRTMLEHKSQYIGSIVLIALSCLMFSLFGVVIENVDINNKEYRNVTIQEDAQFMVQKNIGNISEIESKYNALIEERTSFDYNFTNSKTLRLFTPANKVDKAYITEGRNIKNSREILLDPAFARAQKIKIGNNFKIYNKNYKVTGFYDVPDYIYTLKSESDLVPDPNTFGIGIISKEDFNALNKGFIFYSVKFNNTDKSSLKADLDKNFKLLSWMDINENPRVSYVDAKIKSSYQMIKVLPISMLLLICILIGIILWRTLKQEFVQIGTLYALGYKKKEILRHYLSYSIIVSFTGSILGTILGLISVNPMLSFFLSYFKIPVIKTNFSFDYSIVSIFLPAVFLIPTAYFVIKKALRQSPLELIRGGMEKVKAGFMETKLNLDRFSFNTKFRIRELIRNIPRTLLMVLGVSFASMLLLLGFCLQNSMDYMMKDNYKNVYKYEYDYTFKSFETDKLTTRDGYSYSPFSIKDDNKSNFVVYGINPNTKYIVLKDKKGAALDLNSTIITKSLAEKLKIKEGGTIKITNKLNAKDYDFKIDKIADVYIGDFIFMPLDKLNSELNYPSGSYLGVWSDRKADIDENKILKTLSKQESIDSYKTMLAPMQASVGSIGVMAFIIGLIVIYVVTSLVIEENKGNISLLKVLGYSKKNVYSLILNTNTPLVILGYVISIPLLISSISAMFKSVSKDVSLSFPIKISPLSLIIGFIIIMLTYELSKILNRRKINRVSMSEALKSRAE